MNPEPSPHGTELIRCNLCDANDPEPLFEAPVRPHRVGVFNRDVWSVVRCPHCGLVYVNPRPDDEARSFFYSFKNPGDRKAVQARFIDGLRPRRPLWKRYLRVLGSGHPPGARLLDVGCGTGDFLAEARSDGYEVLGQEVSELFIEHARSREGLQILAGPLETQDFESGTFDIVTAFDVIEHISDPRNLCDQVRDLLREGGLFMLSTHDFGSIFARIHGVKWRYLHPVSHITYFTRRTLVRMLEESSFEIVRIGGSHTIDGSRLRELRNWIVQFGKLVVFRSLLLYVYGPVTRRWPKLAAWRLKIGGRRLDHDQLMARAGDQVAMNDGVVIVARAA